MSQIHVVGGDEPIATGNCKFRKQSDTFFREYPAALTPTRVYALDGDGNFVFHFYMKHIDRASFKSSFWQGGKIVLTLSNGNNFQFQLMNPKKPMYDDKPAMKKWISTINQIIMANRQPR